MNHSPDLDRLFQALSDGHRRAMIDALSAGPLTVSALAQPLDISLPAVMQHLTVLEQAGLVQSAKQGRVRTCALAPGALMAAEDWLSARRRMVAGRLDRLAEFLGREPEDPT